MEINKLAFSGGAIKGVAYVGVFKKIEEMIHERILAESSEHFDPETCKIQKFNIITIL